jgi:hypothetical protein
VYAAIANLSLKPAANCADAFALTALALAINIVSKENCD